MHARSHMPITRSRNKPAVMQKNPAARKRRAVMADTDSVSSHLCRETLERLGFDIERVDSGIAALVAARGCLPDLILMDFQLRDVSAGEAIGWLRSHRELKVVPVVVVGVTEESKLSMKELPAIVGLGKPLSQAALEKAVRGLCG